jgi:hypothetical protein
LSVPKILFVSSVVLCGVIGTIAFFKNRGRSPEVCSETLAIAQVAPSLAPAAAGSAAVPAHQAKKGPDIFVDIDRIDLLFTTDEKKLPIVETISYTSRVPWLKGRPAWIADYASYYATSRHFIARSLNRKPDYFSQKIMAGSKFNVFRKDKHIEFHLAVDISRCKMALYYFDLDTKERVLLKTYRVAVGALDPQRPSGTLTPLGKYSLGNKVAIYKPGVMGYFQDRKVEMVGVFGTRWIPFDHELEGATSSARGYGIHGTPWTLDSAGQLAEKRESLGKYESDGSIWLGAEDMEEVFSIIITKPSFIEIVKDFQTASLPGIEVATPTR